MSINDEHSPITAPAEPPPAARLFQMINGYQVSQVVAAAAQLGVADALSDGPRSSAELAEATGAHPDALARLLRACATVGLFTEVERGRFALTPVGACLRSDGHSLRDAAIGLTGPAHWQPWARLVDAVLTGRPVARDALGMDIREYARTHPDEGARFARAMSDLSTAVSAQVAACYDASGFERIVDVGGSQGALLAGLLEAAPRATGVLFDVPEVIAGAGAAIAARGLADRVKLVGGDFFEATPPGGDLYLLKSILHDWPDEDAARILESCYRAARPGSTLLVVEGLLPSGPAPSSIHLMDLAMLVAVDGRERTREEYEELLEGAGYQLERVIPIPASYYPWNLIEARRR